MQAEMGQNVYNGSSSLPSDSFKIFYETSTCLPVSAAFSLLDRCGTVSFSEAGLSGVYL
jgi:hypothetical protein